MRHLGLRRRLRRTPIARAARRWSSLVLPYRKLAATPAILDAEYEAGQWDYLRGLDELARFSVVAGYCRFLKPHGSILELGCGEGILYERLGQAMHGRYVGVDVSAEAIARAASRAGANAAFVCADAEHYDPDGTFDVIVFNEVLEYFDDPARVVDGYRTALAADGVFVVSMFAGVDTARARRIWKRLDAANEPVDATRIVNRRGHSWTVKVLRPRSG